MAWDLGSIVATLKVNTGDFISGMNIAGDAVSSFNKTTETGLSQAARTLGQTGALFTAAFTVPFVQFSKYSINAAADFQQAMATVQGVAQVTDAELEQLSNRARELGRDTVFSATESAEAFYYMALAGWDTVSMLEAIEPVLKLAAAGSLDLGRASDIVTDAITAFGYSASDTQRFVDVLTQTMANSNTDVNQLGEAFKYVATTAGQLEFSVEDVALALGIMADQGIKAGQSGRSLNQLLQSLKSPTDAAAEAMREYNITLFNADGSARPLQDILINLREAFAGLTDEETAYLASTLTTINGQRSLNAILNASDEDFYSLANSIANATGATDELYDIMTNTFEGKLTIFKSAVESLGITIGERLLPFLTGIVERLTSFVAWLDNLNPAIQNVILVIGALLAAIGPILIAMSLFIKSYQTIRDFKILLGITKLLPSLSGLAGAIGSVVSAVVAFLGPIGLAIAAIAAIGAALVYAYNHFEGFKKVVDDTVSAVIGFFKDLGENVAEVFSAIGQWFSDVGDSIGEFAENVGNAVSEFVTNAVETISEFANNIATFFTETIPAHLKQFALWWTETLPVSIAEGIGFILGIIARFSASIFEFFTKTIPGHIKNFVDWLKDIPDMISESISGAIDNIAEWGAGVWSTFEEWITKTIDDITSWFSEVPGKISDAIEQTIDNVSQWGQRVWSQFSEWITKTVSDVTEWFSKLPGNIWNAIKQAINNVAEWGKQLFETAKEAAINTFNVVIEEIGKIPGKVVEIGKDIVRGIWNGITSLGGWLGNQIKGFCDGVVSGFKKALAIFSPSRVARGEIGKPFGQGVGLGITDSLPEVLNEVDDFVDNIIDEMTEGLDAQLNINPIDALQESLEVEPTFVSVLVDSFDNFITQLNDIVDNFNGFTLRYANGAFAYETGTIDDSQPQRQITDTTSIVIENINVRNDDDIERITRGLYDRQQRNRRSNGIR